jgi:hypothetical protein
LNDPLATDAVIAEQLALCGFVQVENLFDLEFMRQLKEEYEEFKAQPDLYESLRLDNLRAGRKQTYVPFSGVFKTDKLLRHPRALSIVSKQLNSPPSLDHMVFVNADPYSPIQDLHYDTYSPGSVSLQIPLVDYTDPDMGILHVCDRSHAGIDKLDRRLAVAACLKKNESTVRTPLLTLGSALIYDSSVIHRSKAHNSAKDRLALYVSYDDTFGWMKYESKPAIEITVDSFRAEFNRLAEGRQTKKKTKSKLKKRKKKKRVQQ